MLAASLMQQDPKTHRAEAIRLLVAARRLDRLLDDGAQLGVLLLVGAGGQREPEPRREQHSRGHRCPAGSRHPVSGRGGP
jgi:hypothetical protein